MRPNETLEVIAGSYGFEVNELARYNKLDTTQALRVGQIIYFPSDIVSEQPDRPSAEPGRALDARVFPDSAGDPVSWGRPLDARAFPRPDGSSVDTERARLMPYINDGQLSGKEASFSQYGSQTHYASTSDFDYNFAQKDDRQQANQASNNLYMMRNNTPSGNRMVLSAEDAIQDAIDDFEGTIGDDESPALQRLVRALMRILAMATA